MAKLNELGFVGRGRSRHRPRNAAFLYGGPYPFFQTGDIKAAGFHLTRYTQTYSEHGLAQSKLWKPGTLCITIAANIAESAILGIDGCFPDSVVGYVADNSIADVRFIKYYLDTLKIRMQNISRGTTQDNLSLEKLLTFDFCVPTLTVQRQVAGVLSAYDELIENDQKRIAILDAMIGELYREWFVYFHFPGHASQKLSPSVLGNIPDGWEVKRIGEAAKLFRGLSYRSIDLGNSENDGIPFINLKCIGRDGGFRRTGVKRYIGDYADRHLAKKGDIVIAITDMTQERRVVARAALVPSLIGECGVFSMDLVRIECRPPMTNKFLYAFLRFSAFANEVKLHANGANVLHLIPDRITDFRFAMPQAAILNRFSEVVGPKLDLIESLESRIENLRRTRDMLLPRLLSGQTQSISGEQ